MKQEWAIMRLGDAATFINGYPFKPSDWSNIGLPIIRIQNLTESSQNINYYAGQIDKRYLIQDGDVLISWSASLGVYEWKNGNAWLNQHIFKVKFDKIPFEKSFFKYVISAKLDHMSSVAHGATMKHITKKNFDEITIPYPPLLEQRRLAEILSTVNLLIEQRKHQIEKLDLLAKSRFIEMFGDPVTNPKEWESGTIRDIASEVKYGTSSPATEGGKYIYLRMNNITYDGHLDLSNLKHIDLPDDQLAKYQVQKGDVLFNRTNSKELVGKTCVFKEDIPMVIAGYIIRVRVNARANPEYLSAILNSKYGKRTLLDMCKSIVGQANINAQELQNIDILIPPLALQNEFAAFIEQLDKSKFSVSQQQKTIDSYQRGIILQLAGGE